MSDTVYSMDGDIYRYEDLRDMIDVYDLKPGSVIYAGEKSERPASYYIDADSIIDQMGERAMDEAGESAEDFPDVSKEARQELKLILSEWANKNCPVHFFPVVNDREYTITQEDFDNA